MLLTASSSPGKEFSMASQDQRVFLYHAQGYALGGRIDQPVAQDLNSHAATSLSAVGGYTTATNGPFNLDRLISYASAHTYISGIQSDTNTHSTVVDCVITGLNILDVITADSIVGRISSKHTDGQPAEILTVGSSFVNLRIGGLLADVTMCNDTISLHPTSEGLLAHYEGKCKADAPCAAQCAPANPRYEWGLPPGPVPDALKKLGVPPPGKNYVVSNDSLYSSIVCQVSVPGGPGEPPVVYGNQIVIPQVGTLYLGELVTDPDAKRLTMLRLELGCPVTGRVAASGPGSNGKWFP